MISLALARQLKRAGLVWVAGANDFFAIPDRGLDDRVFVISEVMANLDIFRGWPVVTFHGTAEWALDYILTTEAVWMPREEQLREVLAARLAAEGERPLQLSRIRDGYRCTITFQGQTLHFDAATGADAYAKALLHVLRAVA